MGGVLFGSLGVAGSSRLSPGSQLRRAWAGQSPKRTLFSWAKWC